MLYIDDELPNVKRAKELHINRMYCYVNRKINGKKANCRDKTCEICESKTRGTALSDHVRNVLATIDLKQLIGALPDELLNINQQFNQRLSAQPTTVQEIESISNVFDYDWFCTNDWYTAYNLCNGLEIGTCVYCNRLYTTTAFMENGEQIIRPTLDHWFPKADYPLLAVSFYNLIPSCSPCNSSVKHRTQFTLKEHIHPYLNKDITQNYTLRSIYDETLGSFKVSVETANLPIKSTLAAMKIADIYQHHQSELKDLDLLKRKYNQTYLQDLGKLLDTTLTEKDAYRLMFGVEYEDENFHKRPLSKLKKDILNIKIN